MIFQFPWLLAALAVLPVIWLLLRALPPAPRRQSFPAIMLLRGLHARVTDAATAPPWLLLLRCLALAGLIVGLAGPVVPRDQATGPRAEGSGDPLLVLDNGWAAVPGWTHRLAALDTVLDRAGRAGRHARLLTTAPGPAGETPAIGAAMTPSLLRGALDSTRAMPWPTDRAAAARALRALAAGGWRGPVVYVSDGLAGPDDPAFAAALAAIGPVRTLTAPDLTVASLVPPAKDDPGAAGDTLRVALAALPQPHPRHLTVRAEAADGGVLALVPLSLAAGADRATAGVALPAELRNRIDRLVLDDMPGPAGMRLLDEGDRRRPVGLIGVAGTDTPLVGPLFYLRRALAPTAELREGSAATLLARPLSVLVAPDGALDSPQTRRAVAAWVRKGGMLVRFAGPLLNGSPDRDMASPDMPAAPMEAPQDDAAHLPPADTLLPVPLMQGERQLGGAMSWGKPEQLAPFPDASPFHGLPIPPEVTVSRQVLARPAADLADHSWARLSDGTPLVTHAALGAGEVVLFHVTSTADWSNLPLSGLFVAMLRRLAERAAGVEAPADHSLLAPYMTLDSDAILGPPPPGARALPADAFGTQAASSAHPPGLYGPRTARRALNLGDAMPPLSPQQPIGQAASLDGQRRDLVPGPWLVAAAVLLLVLDALLTQMLRAGRLAGGRRAAALVVAGLLAAHAPARPALADPPPAGVPGAALETRLGYILTGHDDIDTVSRQGLQGLSDYANARTSAVLGHPDGVVPGRDDLSYYPMLYWPVTADATADPARAAALNAYMRHGGILMIDSQGVDPAAPGGGHDSFAAPAPGTAAALRRMTQGLDIPPLTRLTDHHVLAHTFYLLHGFPGRYDGLPVWVAREGDSANDGVSPVIVGASDWAHAWAVDAQGDTPYATMPDGNTQRVAAYRFGVNAVLYALTGNYKADQVHVPALLRRLGE
ncbi:conserved hypothetical protein [Gluconacetobacter diazotrophicus PA1 5]|uniref:DUF4159 domain-containing protein n=1 Tax=Gluconacetobacter diazotrophicus TaxID=33996 RepID=UPI000173B838|nr:DUF4159 domain-containing protein [Gluconacetobacter diazotrophicus]ACI52741.1 conserved hypothetical protein [Gluconacetobacter diazotrophicus PA1 5]TWB06135.1 putative membrane protein (TIGR02226 family) [Gluconacetobacter diazotrophicus]